MNSLWAFRAPTQNSWLRNDRISASAGPGDGQARRKRRSDRTMSPSMAVTRNFSTTAGTRCRSRRGMSTSSPSALSKAMWPAPGTICSGSRAARSFWTCKMVSTGPACKFRFSRSEAPGPKRCSCRARDIQSFDPVATWIRQLARLITGSSPSWDMLEVASDGVAAVPPRRTPPRSGTQYRLGLVWNPGTAKPMGLGPTIAAGGPPWPLDLGHVDRGGASGVYRGRAGGRRRIGICCGAPSISSIAVSPAVFGITLSAMPTSEAQRLVLRSELMTAQTMESFDRLADVVVQRGGHAGIATDPADPLLGACRMAADAVRAPFVASPQPALAQRGFAGVVEIARVRAACAFAGRCCGASGGKTTSARWWPGTARREIRSRCFAAEAAAM